MRYVCLLMLLLLPSFAFAQSTVQPQVTVEAPTEPITVGQPAIIRIKILVPTFMPSPPVFPSLEQEGLLVRLPERASGPVSETVDGDTWSGVQRSYRLYPLQTGGFDLSGQSVGVTFANPETNEPVQVTVDLPAMTLNAQVPEGAQDLDPIIIAQDFKVEQFVDGGPDVPSGGAVTRRLTSDISGTTPLLIPNLMPEAQSQMLRAYPKEPKVTETEDRGILSGKRVDEVVYLAQEGGEAQLPEISVHWFSLSNNQIETIDIPAVELSFAAPPREPLSTEDIVKTVLWSSILIFFTWLIWNTLWPRIQNRLNDRRQRYLRSSAYASDTLRTALKNQDLSAAYAALDLWKSRSPDGPMMAEVERCLIKISAARYSGDTFQKTEEWHTALSALGKQRRPRPQRVSALPPLNP